jgi:pimeloyl-ACP methyl ester carboxylesterase
MTFQMLESCIEVNGSSVPVLRGGDAGGCPMVFFDGSVPGVTPYGGGSHIWGPVLEQFAGEGAVVAVDGAASPALGTLQDLQSHMAAVLQALDVRSCHVVAFDHAALAALLLASERPHLFSGITVVDSSAAVPTGDGVENVTFAHPLFNRTTRKAQRWALERMSYAHTHIDERLLQLCELTAESATWLAAAERMQQADAQREWSGGLLRAKARLFEICRTSPGIPVPVQVVWGTHDPLASFEQGLWLYRLVAAHQPVAHFHAVNRSGAMPFREGADTFYQIVASFRDVLSTSASA